MSLQVRQSPSFQLSLQAFANTSWNTKQQALSAIAILPSWHGKQLLQKINSLNRKPNQTKKLKTNKQKRYFCKRKGKTKKKGTEFLQKNLKTVLKLGRRGCLRSFPVFSLTIIHSLARGKADSSFKWRPIRWDVGEGIVNGDIGIVSIDMITRHVLNTFFSHWKQ